jgi:adenosylmethionine-8-amino-7-oxononanoate aminotransferase
MRTNPFWHPFADMHALADVGELQIDRGEGVYVFDSEGRRYLDATASLWYCNVGHGRQEIGRAAAEQMARLAAYSTFGDLTNRPIAELAERLAALAPFPDAAAFFTSGGSDCIDTAVKLVRKYWALMGQPDRRVVISRSGSYHGMHVAGTSLAGIEPNRADYGEMLPEVQHVAWDSAEELEKVIANVGAERVAAFFCEPVVGAGGVFHPPAGYLAEVERICRETGVLLVADEVVTGYGRLGEWFACQRYGIEPDILVSAKGLTSGYLPMGALLVGPRVKEPFYDGTAGLWRHGYTYSGHAAVAAAALANLDILEREGLVSRSRQLESVLAAALRPLEKHPLVSEVRVAEGLLAAVQIDPAAISVDAALPARTVAELRSLGVLTRTLATGAIHVSPALVITEDQLHELADGVAVALDRVS